MKKLLALCLVILCGIVNAENSTFNTQSKIANIPVIDVNGVTSFTDVQLRLRDDGLFELINYKQYSPPAPTINNGSKGKWIVNEDINPIDDSKRVIMSLLSDSGASQFRGNFSLVIRCISNKPDIYINWGTFLAGKPQNVTTRVDSGNAETAGWSISTDSLATFYPSYATVLINQLLNKAKFTAQTNSYSDGVLTGVWNISGIENAIIPLKSACGLQ